MHSPTLRWLAAITFLVLLAACGSSEAEDTTSSASDATANVQTPATTAGSDEDDSEADGDAAAAETTDVAASASSESENVEINLLDELDGILNGYCLDIAGGNENVDPANGLQAHTCYSYDGDLGTDQVFATADFSNNQLYMPIYDVCAQVESVTVGAAVTLGACDGSEAQSIVFEADGTLRPASDTTLCFTAGADSRTGRSGDHQIRDLAIEACSDDLASLQQWGFRTGL